MKVAVIGAGALGSVYGVRLVTRANVDVAFVVRPARAGAAAPIAIESGSRSRERDRIASPVRVTAVPDDADAIVVAIGTEDIDALSGLAAASNAPIVVLTPMLPKGWARVRAVFGDRVHAAMPSVVAYTRKDDGVVRYWLAPVPTTIDEPKASSSSAEVVRELAGALSRAGIRSRLELGVHEKNPATTVSFIAIGMVLSLAGSVRGLAEDDALLSLATRACREGVRLGHRLGRPTLWASLAPALSAPWALRAWLRALARLSPEGLFYAEEHFGRKLRDQHRVMIREMVDLAEEKRLPHEALDELAARLRSA